jgi:hypothetical protein
MKEQKSRQVIAIAIILKIPASGIYAIKRIKKIVDQKALISVYNAI